MNQVDLDKYYQDVFSLARTMIIKIDKIAELDNNLLASAGYEVLKDKRTWRYYMNLNGEYHEQDKPMYVESIDTGEIILFSKANLEQHLITQREYRRGGYWYDRLLGSFPSQIVLINGILSPISYERSVEAKDYSILHYDSYLVDPQEEQLIPKIQKHIDSLIPQLFNNEYIITDDLFLTLMVQLLYSEIVKVIHTIRLEDCYTRYTNDFFIWSHIDSFGDFSQYRNSLTRDQTMWLFRNISWITRNPGKKYVFDKLLYNILTKAEIPVSESDVVLDVERQVMELTPNPIIRKNNLNLLSSYGSASSYITPARLIQLQSNLTVDNKEEETTYLEDLITKAKYSPISSMKTKTLESTMQDSTNSHAITLMNTVMHEWIYLTHKNVFQGRVVIVNPKNGVQSRIGVADAFNLWTYLLARTRLEDPVEILPVHYQDVLKVVPPSEKDIINLVGEKYLSKELLVDIRDKYIPVAVFFAPDYLIQYSSDVYRGIWQHRKIYSQYFDIHKRARIKYATSLMYESGAVKLGTKETYQEILDEHHLILDDFSINEMRLFAWDIFKRVTGWDTNVQPSMRVKQNELIEIMEKLSSYTVHFITEMNDSSSASKLPNEIFIGKGLNGGKSRLDGDFSNVNLNVASNLHSESIMDATVKPTSKDSVANETKIYGFSKLKDNSVLKAVNIKDINFRATRIRTINRIREVTLP